MTSPRWLVVLAGLLFCAADAAAQRDPLFDPPGFRVSRFRSSRPRSRTVFSFFGPLGYRSRYAFEPLVPFYGPSYRSSLTIITVVPPLPPPPQVIIVQAPPVVLPPPPPEDRSLDTMPRRP